MRLGPRTLRTRILTVVITVAVFPPVLVGFWLSRATSRSGEELLQSRLQEYVGQVTARIGANWVRQRSDLLFVAEHGDVRRALDRGRPVEGGDVRRVFEALGTGAVRATVRDMEERGIWTLERPAGGARTASAGVLVMDLPVHRGFPSERLGDLEVHVEFGALLGESPVAPAAAGMVLGAFDVKDGTSLLPVPFDPSLLEQPRFTWGGDEWLTESRGMTDPPLRLVAAAPVSPFKDPFEGAARRGTWWLTLVALCGVLGAALITGGLTRRLERLATAADAVSRGDLDQRTDEAGPDEVVRVATAFNTMTANLRRTLDELAARERLAAVGEFAASLAHEVRNPLSAIRLDLQRVEEDLDPASPLRGVQARALSEIERLDATVGEALDQVKGRRWTTSDVALTVPLTAAADAAEPAFAARGATLGRLAEDHRNVHVVGDPRPLEQVFLNLLLNAAASLEAGGRAWIEVAVHDSEVIVSVNDSGRGMPPEVIARAFEPLYSTRADGTGLGLTVARRIVEAHGGAIDMESEPGRGTTARVRLQLAEESRPPR